MFHNSKTTRLVYPLALGTNNVHLQPSKWQHFFHNSKRTHSVYPSALPLQPKVGFILVNLSTRNSTRRNLPTYLQNFNWLLKHQRIFGKVHNVVSGSFCVCNTHPLRTFAPDQCIPLSTIMQFRRNVYEYSMKKLRLSLQYAK